MIKKILHSIFIVTISFLFVGVLYFFSESEKENGFKRNFANFRFEIKEVKNLQSTRFYFAGKVKTRVYLTNIDTPEILYSTNLSLQNSKRHILNSKPIFKNSRGYSKVWIKDSIITITNGKTGNITVVNEKTKHIYKYQHKNLYFDEPLIISNTSLVARELKFNGNFHRTIVKINPSHESSIIRTMSVEKKSDTFISSDGFMRFDSKNLQILYLFAYRGEYFVLDTNLNILSKNKTIDTITHAKSIVEKKIIDKEKGNKTTIVTQKTPPKIVNRYITSDENHIFISSAIKADNETSSSFRKNNVIDVYSATNGLYLYSFYLPRYKSIKLKEFQVRGNIIIGLSDKYLLLYKIDRN